jgi:hypothetical protein
MPIARRRFLRQHQKRTKAASQYGGLQAQMNSTGALDQF